MKLRILFIVLVIFSTLSCKTQKAQGSSHKASIVQQEQLKIASKQRELSNLWDEHGALEVSKNSRYLEHADGTPFLWLGDTAWGFFQELNQEDADLYLSTRAAQGFTVIQAVVVMGWNRGWNDANAYGERPFHNGNEDTPNEAFWQHADWLINKAEEHGLYVAILPAWGRFWTGNFSDNSAKNYATWIANRYKGQENVIWVNGGDTRPSENQTRWNVIGNAMRAADPNHLITFHARGGMSNMSSNGFHNQDWLDFNMFQTGHGVRDRRSDAFVDKDWGRSPSKPTLDGEQCYEDHHIGWKANNDTFRPYDVRQVAYWSVFAGGTGVTYGHVHVWDFYHGGNKEDGYKDWKVQMLDDGAVYMGILHQLMMSRPHAGRGPAQHLFNSNPSGSLKQRATQGDGYVMAYTSQGQNINIQMPFAQNTCWWFNPRDGTATLIGTFAQGSKDFDCPGGTGRDHDWVLVIDDASKGYGEPGKPGPTPTPTPTSTPTPVEKQLGIRNVSASGSQNPNVPEKTIDDDLNTRWAVDGYGQWTQYELDWMGSTVTKVKIAFYNGKARTCTFDVQVSPNGSTWTTAAAGLTSSGTTLQLEEFDIPDTIGTYVRLVGHGNSDNNWNSK